MLTTNDSYYNDIFADLTFASIWFLVSPWKGVKISFLQSKFRIEIPPPPYTSNSWLTNILIDIMSEELQKHYGL